MRLQGACRRSGCRGVEVEWLQVYAAGDTWVEDYRERVDYEASATTIRAEVEAYRREWIECKESKRVTPDAKEGLRKRVYPSATKHGDVCVTWILLVKPGWVDKAWEKVSHAVGQETLGCSAKVSPCKELGRDGRALNCVYVSNFSDRADVRRVLVELPELRLFVQNGHKCDTLTVAWLETQVLKSLKLHDSWQLLLDVVRDYFHRRAGRAMESSAGLSSFYLGRAMMSRDRLVVHVLCLGGIPLSFT